MLNIKERNANTVQPPEADTVVLFLDAADSKLKLKDSSGDISEVSTNVIGIPDGGATGEVLAKASGDGGDVEWIDTTGGVKEYVALLTQTGTDAPVATVLKNTLDVTPTYLYVAAGEYTLNDADETPFMVSTKTVITFGQNHNNNDFVNMSFYLYETFAMRLYVTHGVTGNGIDSNMTITPIKIEVYP